MNRIKFITAIAAVCFSVQASVVIDFTATGAGGAGVSETSLTLNNLSDAVTLISSTPPAVPEISSTQNRFSSAGVSGTVAIKISAVAEFNPAAWSLGAQPERLVFFLGNANWPGWGVLSAVVRTGFIDEGEALIFTVDLSGITLPAGHVFVFKGVTFHSGSKYTGEIWLQRAGDAPLQISAREAGLILKHGDQIAVLKGADRALLQTIEFDVMTEADASAESKEDAPSGPGLNVFTAGHSFHVWAADQVKDMALSAGFRGHQIAGMSRIGGSTVLKHWDVPDESNLLKKMLTAGEVDVLTLSPIWLPDEGIEKFAELAAQYSTNVRITVQEFWLPNDTYVPVYPLQVRAGCDHNAITAAELRRRHEPYFQDMDNALIEINRKIGRDILFVVPAGQAVILLREKVIAGEVPGVNTQETLFRDSWGHANIEIQILASYCHYAVIYRQNPKGLPVPAALAAAAGAKGVSAAEIDRLNQMLQEFAWKAVIEHPLSGVRGGGAVQFSIN